MGRKFYIFALTGLLLAAVAVQAASPPPRAAPRPKDGDYALIVAGMATGSGSAGVTGDRMSIGADIVNEAGTKGRIDATVTLKNNHFTGTGVVMGKAATFNGRIDQPADVSEKAINGVRLSCTFKTVDSEYGRIIGNLPSHSPTATTNPDSGDTGKGPGRGAGRPDDQGGDRKDNPDRRERDRNDDARRGRPRGGPGQP